MATEEKVIDFASKLKAPIPNKDGVIDFASRLKQPQQRGGLLPPPERPIRGGVAAQITPGLRQATESATGEDTSPGAFDIVTGESRRTPETEALPEIMQLSERGILPGKQDIGQAVAFMTASNTQERMQMLEQVIPGIQFRKDEKGNDIATLPDGREAVVNKPGFSRADALQIVSEIGKFAPAGRLSAMGQGILKKIGLGALAAGSTQAATEAASVPAGGEFGGTEVATAAVLGGAAETVGPAISGMVNRARGRAVGAATSELEAVAPSIREATAATEATGVPLFQAQQTGIPAALEKQAFVAQLPAGTQAALKGLKTQNKAAGEAVEDFMKSIAPDEALETGAVRFRTAAEKAVAFKKAIRKEFTSDFYKDAYAQNPAVNIKPVRDLLDKTRTRFPEKAGKFKTSLDEVENLLSGKTETIPGSPLLDAKGNLIKRATKKTIDPTLEQLHGAKMLIDDMIARTGEDSIGNTGRGVLRDIQTELLKQMDSSSDLYRVAREQFARESPLVDRVTKGILGRIEKVKDPQLKTISKTIFDAAETNPLVLQRVKRAIDLADPEAWNELLRIELQRRIGTIGPELLETAGETVENVPGQLFRAIFGKDPQTKVLKAALNEDQRKNLNFLQVALKRASLGRAPGSQTAGREEIKKELRGGVANALSVFFEPVKSAAEGLRGATFDKRTRAMAEALFDPQWKPRMEKLRKLDIQSPAAAKAMTQLLNDIEQSQPTEETQ